MLHDARGLELTAASAEAAVRYDATIDGYLGFRSDVGDRLKETLAADPQFPLALCTRGYFMLLFAARGLVERAQQSLNAAKEAAETRGATPRERRHLSALEAWCSGDVTCALGHWEAILAAHPRDVLALKLANFWHFYLGDAAALRDSVARVLPAWDETVPGYGYVLGLQAFGQEEARDYAAAERTGRRAIALNPGDIWAAHAVAHVMEMQDRASDGVAWIDGLAAQYGACNNFRFHLWWHRCLFLLELEEYDRVLALYDREVAVEKPEYLDICNAAALLWRLEDLGVTVGDRWAALAAHAGKRTQDHMLVFTDAHYALALAAGDKSEAADRFLASARSYASSRAETEAEIMAEVGADLCEAAVALRRGALGRAIELLQSARPRLHRIGGSHAQRDLFEKMLISAAVAAGRRDLARDLLAERLRQRPANRWGEKTLRALA